MTPKSQIIRANADKINQTKNCVQSKKRSVLVSFHVSLTHPRDILERGSWLHWLVRHCQFPMMQKGVQPSLWPSLGRSTWALKWSYLSRHQSVTFLFLLQFQFKFLPRLPSMVTWKYKLNKSSPFIPWVALGQLSWLTWMILSHYTET